MSVAVGAVASGVLSPLAHGGGAPEAAMIGLPLLLFAVFLLLERRARRRDAAADGTEPEAVTKRDQLGQDGPNT